MIRIFAQAVSIIFQPLLLTTYLFLGIFFFHPLVFSPLSWDAGKWIVMLLAITTFAIPLLGIIILRIFSNLSSLSMMDRGERVIPFFFISGFYIVTTLMIWDRLNLHPLIIYLLAIISFLILIIAFITIKYKISAHSAGIAGIFGLFWAFSLRIPAEPFSKSLAVISILVGLVLSARLYLNAHTFAEVFWGALLGFSICFLSILLLY